MNRKKWQIMPIDQELILQLSQELNIDPHAVLLAYTRGIDDVCEAAEFFGVDDFEEVDPYLFPDMGKAVERIKKALDEFEQIAVYGDYDVDGVTATAILYLYLESVGANVSYYIPDRMSEGYGLNCKAVDELHNRGVKLIVTVDNGISAIEETEYIKSLGMDIVITDHHLPGEILPDACAVVDPHIKGCQLDFCDYVGAGVAYKLVCALEGEFNQKTESFMDLVALGTVADVMPLMSENRSFVKRGLSIISDSPRIGIAALRAAAATNEKEPSSTELAFALAPRLNAAGRMGSAQRGLKLLISSDEQEAKSYAEEMNDENAFRQKTEQEITALAIEQIESNASYLADSVIVVSGKGWHEGVIGIVASRIVERYGKPAIVISTGEETAKGSGRSIEGFSLYDALDAVKDTLMHFGGHKLAAGLSVEASKIEEFRHNINKYAAAFDMPFMIQRIDYKLKLRNINETLLSIVEAMEPCGAGNPQPIFGLYNMTIESVTPIGSGKHIKLELSRNNIKITAVKFSCSAVDFPYEKGDVVDLAVSVKANEFMGRVSVSIIIKNMRMHGIDEDRILKEIRLYERLLRGETLTPEQAAALTPGRELNKAIYIFLRSREIWRHGEEVLCSRLGEARFGAVCVSLESMKQMGIINYSEGTVTLPSSSSKVDLDDAPIIKRLKELREGKI